MIRRLFVLALGCLAVSCHSEEPKQEAEKPLSRLIVIEGSLDETVDDLNQVTDSLYEQFETLNKEVQQP